MSSNNKYGIIHDANRAEADPAVDRGSPSIAPYAGSVIHDPQAWQNRDWAVTDHGLESRVIGPDRRVIERLIPVDRLLETRRDLAGVSLHAAQLASKTWVKDVEPLIEAYRHAVDRHHPGQTAIDIAATAAEVRRVWGRSRPSQNPDDLGHDYLEDAEKRFDQRRAAAAAAEAAVAADDWTAAYPAKFRAVLREHGVDDEGHANARELTRRLIDLAAAGLPAEDIKDRAGTLFDELIFEREREPDPEFEAAIDDLVDWAMWQLEIKRGK